MFDLVDLGNILPQVPVLGIQIKDIQISIEPSDFFLLPSIHIDAQIEVRFPW